MGGYVMSERMPVWGTLPDHGSVLTTAEYLQTAESSRVQELAFGTLRVAESPTALHQSLVLEMAVALRDHVLSHELGSVWIAPLDVILDPARALIVQPDLFFVSTAREHIVTDRIWGAPDLVVEVLSPNPRIGSTEERIRWFARYGVRECWLVHQLAREIEVLQLDGDTPPQRRTYQTGQNLASRVLPSFRTTPRMFAGWS
jgi:Uma2 family endonuclease